MQRHVEGQLEDYLSGSLSLREQREIREHLSRCRSCERALAETRDSQSYLAWLVPTEAPPTPGPGFYFRVQEAIERKTDSGWFSELARSFQPRLAYPVLLLGLLFVAWTMTFEVETDDDGLLAVLPTQFSTIISSEAERLDSRDLVMATLVDVMVDMSEGD